MAFQTPLLTFRGRRKGAQQRKRAIPIHQAIASVVVRLLFTDAARMHGFLGCFAPNPALPLPGRNWRLDKQSVRQHVVLMQLHAAQESCTATLSPSDPVTLRTGPGMASQVLSAGMCEQMWGNTKSSGTADSLYSTTPHPQGGEATDCNRHSHVQNGSFKSESHCGSHHGGFMEQSWTTGGRQRGRAGEGPNLLHIVIHNVTSNSRGRPEWKIVLPPAQGCMWQGHHLGSKMFFKVLIKSPRNLILLGPCHRQPQQ